MRSGSGDWGATPVTEPTRDQLLAYYYRSRLEYLQRWIQEAERGTPRSTPLTFAFSRDSDLYQAIFGTGEFHV